MRVVVTGGAGFLGSHLCARFLADGHDVVGLDNFITGARRNLERVADNPSFTFIEQDVTKFIDIPGEIDLVLHFASPASPRAYIEFGIQTLKVGALGTHNALGLAKEKGSRFLLASTSEVYGDPLVHPQTEDYWGNVNPVGPRGVYDEGKRFAEAMAMAYNLKHGVDTKLVRIFNTYGPFMDCDDGRAAPAFISAALEGKPLIVHGDGSQTRSLCYVDDLIEGIVRLALSDHVGPMNIGNPRELSVLELAKLIVDITNSPSPIEFGPRPPDDPTVRCPDIGLARRVIGWEPVVSLEEGLRRTVAWFAEDMGAPKQAGGTRA
jgi:dTDP-glucose 4,6-dehydratase